MTNKWNLRVPTTEEIQKRDQLAKELDLSPVIALLLVQRGITSAEEVKRFFRPSLNDLHDPFLMPDMDKAVARLNKALGNKEKILIYGDYDVDGTTAVSLVYKYLRLYSTALDYYIPDRYDEGYGISYKGIDYAAERGITLVISLDCGIKAIEKIEYAKQKGIDFIICDHHMPDDVLPDAVAVLDAKRTDSIYPYEHLSGCGVGFKFMQAFAISNNFPFSDLEKLLELTAVSIASDIVPITGENRILAYYGLRQINNNPSLGLKGIIDVCGLSTKDITISDIVFKIGPRINASGRMMNGKEAVELLLAKSVEIAKEKSESINQYNEERRELDKKITDEANAIINGFSNIDDQKAIIVYNPNWHKGVIGIVASRLTEKYYRPAVKIASEEIIPEQMIPQVEIDSMLDFKDITPKFMADLKKMSPFGPENQKPIFCTLGVKDYGTSKLVGKDLEHLKLEIIDGNSCNPVHGIAFGMRKHSAHIKEMKPFSICYTVEENTYNGNSSIQLMVKDIKQEHP